MSTASSYKYFSQYGEDCLLWKFFDYKHMGFYIDIGAFDGVHLSNSYSFEQQGWNGICVEPHPDYFSFCKESRPNSICLNSACISNVDVTKVDFYTEDLGLLSSVSSENDEFVERLYGGWKLDFHGFTKQTVEATTFSSILKNHVKEDIQIDFVSIDVEGTEIDVLQGFDFDNFSPTIFVIEANSEEARESLSTFMLNKGYLEARRLGVNIFYVKSLQDYKKIRSIDMSCNIEKTMHPKGEKYTIPQCITGYSVVSLTTQSQLQQTQSQLQQTQSQLQQTQSQLQQTQSQLQQTQSQLQQTQSQLQQTQAEVAAVTSSKFWKLRTQWFKLKKIATIFDRDK